MRLVNILMITCLGLMLSACSSTQHDQAAEAAIQRADMIAQLLPMDIEGYSLVRARAQDAIIELTLLEKNAKKSTGTALFRLKTSLLRGHRYPQCVRQRYQLYHFGSRYPRTTNPQ